MKEINTYIIEKFKITKNTINSNKKFVIFYTKNISKDGWTPIVGTTDEELVNALNYSVSKIKGVSYYVFKVKENKISEFIKKWTTFNPLTSGDIWTWIKDNDIEKLKADDINKLRYKK